MELSKIIILLMCVFSFANAQHVQSTYSGQESREINSLSSQEVEGYLSGHGMGFAKAAELNHYPGPKHVLELHAKLNLSKAQIEQTQNIYEEMHKKTVRLGKLLVEKEKFLDDLFLNQGIDARELQASISGISKVRGEIRLAHLTAHLKMKELLRPEQISHYDKLRGYTGGRQKHHHQKSHQ